MDTYDFLDRPIDPDRQWAETQHVVLETCNAIRNIHPIDWTPAVVAQIWSTIAAKTKDSSWGHLEIGQEIINHMDDGYINIT